MNYEHLLQADPELYASMERELARQRDHLELIASENFTSPAVMEAVGSHLTNKYAEGYPGARYYGGCDYVDEVERLAIDRVTRLFGADHANVQPHSGSQANMAVYAALLQPAFRAYQQQVVKNAAVLAETLQQGGVRLVSGGTDNHLMLADVYSRGRTGAQMQDLLDAANITANKNTIPFDTQSVRVTSGVRLGTPAVTTRGMGEDEMREIGALICRLIDEGEAAVPTVRAQVLDLCARFPLYPDLHM